MSVPQAFKMVYCMSVFNDKIINRSKTIEPKVVLPSDDCLLYLIITLTSVI